MEVKTDSLEVLHARIKTMNKDNVNELNFVIDEMNSFDFKSITMDQETAQDMLKHLTRLMPEKNEHILSKFCHIVNIFCNKLKLVPDEQNLHLIMDYLIRSATTCRTWVQADVLFALSSVLYIAAELPKHHEQFFELLLGWISGSSDGNLQLAALKCLQRLTSRNMEALNIDTELVTELYLTVLSCLKASFPHSDQIKNCEIALSCLKCLQNVYTSVPSPSGQLGEFLGLLKSLQYCGFPGQDGVMPACLYPALISLPVTSTVPADNKQSFPRSKLKKKRPKKKPTKKKYPAEQQQLKNCDNDVVSDGSSSDNKANSYSDSSHMGFSDKNNFWRISGSESDFSDVEGTLAVSKVKTAIRLHAYVALHVVIKATDKKTMFGFWSSFLPETASGASNVNNLSIFTTILKDPSTQVRLCAVNVLAELMRASKQFMSLVDDRTLSAAGHTSFTTASSVLTSMIIELHRSLLLVLVAEKSPLLLTQILKCYATLLDNIPYKRLNVEILFKLMNHLKVLLRHKDLQVHVACMTVFGSILRSDQVPEEVQKFLIQCSDENDLKPVVNVDDLPRQNRLDASSLPWLISVCKNNILDSNPSLPVLVESLQLLSIVGVKYFDFMRNFIELLEKIVLTSLSNGHVFMQLHGAKLFEVVGLGILNDLTKPATGSSSEPISAEVAFAFWNKVLDGPFSLCIVNYECSTLRSVCCDCLSTLPAVIFQRLSHKQQAFCVTVLMNFSSDDDYLVRGAALRCLGIYSLFPSLREDLSFLSDAARILCTGVLDPILIVRTKASWTMGNLTDALFLSRDEYPGFSEEVTVPFIHSIGMAAVTAAKDSDRIQASAVRALGNLLNFLPSDFLGDASIREFIDESQVVLLSAMAAKIMKVTWNVCYAFRNIFKNSCLVSSGLVNLEPILESLVRALGSSNFKVRINASLALAALESRAFYGSLFSGVCASLVEVLKNAEVSLNYRELVHLGNLEEAVCLCLCHLMSLAIWEDLSALSDVSVKAAEVLLTSFWKFGQKADPEKYLIIEKAVSNIERWKSVENSDVSLGLWSDILNQAKSAYENK